MKKHVPNQNLKFAGNDRTQKEFTYIEKFLQGKGIDVGCGTNRLSPDILAIDRQNNKKYSHADVIHDCHDLDIKSVQWHDKEYPFMIDSIDFIFSSHCLEDFEDIPIVFMNWWKKLKPNGYMILLLPDMENERYPKCNDPQGNPSHRTDVGAGYMRGLLDSLKYHNGIKFRIIQIDTIPHNESCTVDVVIQKL